ncbi:MAG: hypothetical protein U5L45_07195 [Saprospiraceae bacterium]|nr:hypothetical protein [Saprospiraceae bacterium]
MVLFSGKARKKNHLSSFLRAKRAYLSNYYQFSKYKIYLWNH